MTTRAEGQLERLVAALRDTYTSLLHLCEELTVADWERPTGCPGWAVRDVFAHVVGLESILAGDPEPHAPLPDDLPHVKNEFGRYMEGHVASRRAVPVADLLLEARDVFSRRLGQIELIDDLETEVPGPMGSRNAAHRMLPIRVFDLWAHEQDIRRAVGRPGHLTGPAAEITLERILKGLAASLGREETLEGHVTLAVTGEQSREVTIDTGTGELVAVPSAGDVRIAMPFVDLVARACGRADAPGPDVVLIEGDTELGKRALRCFAITP